MARGRGTYVCDQDLLHRDDLAVWSASEPIARAGTVRARVVAIQVASAPSTATAPASEAATATEAAATAEGGPAGEAAPA